MSEVETMEKDGNNTFQNYKYLSETQVTTKMKALLTKHKVVFVHSSRVVSTLEWDNAKGAHQVLSNIEATYKFYDVESSEFIEGVAGGQGIDSGDKGVYKAVTGAIKYIFMKNFLIPTGDDPENEKQIHTPAPIAAKPVLVKSTYTPPSTNEEYGAALHEKKKPTLCAECGGLTTYREGTTKTGKPYKAYFCQSGVTEHTQWIK